MVNMGMAQNLVVRTGYESMDEILSALAHLQQHQRGRKPAIKPRDLFAWLYDANGDRVRTAAEAAAAFGYSDDNTANIIVHRWVARLVEARADCRED